MTENSIPEKHADEAMAAELSGEKKGRGPTRAAVKFADLVEDIQKRDDDGLRRTLTEGVTSKSQREYAKTLRANIRNTEREIAKYEEYADILARVEELPAHLRAALVALVEAKP